MVCGFSQCNGSRSGGDGRTESIGPRSDVPDAPVDSTPKRAARLADASVDPTEARIAPALQI
jgi:hypothetical protein